MATATAAAPVVGRVAIPIQLGCIYPSPTNPRKTFSEAKLQELAASISSMGVIDPITVRPHPTLGEGAFDLVVGERRWRACDIAGLTEIPAFVEDLDDATVVERQLVENSQREDVHPIEEGEAFADRIKNHGYTIESLMVTVGKSRAYVYARMQLARLPETVRKLLLEGKLPITIGELATRIGDAALQEQFVRECLGQADDDAHEAIEGVGIVPELVSDDGRPFPPRDASQPLSTRAAAELLRRRYSTRLALAKFPTSDPGLTSAGSCVTCPHRSGNQPELPGVPGHQTDDVCRRPSCYADKTRAAWERAAREAESRGMKVVPAEAATRVFSADGVTVSAVAPFVDPDQEVPANLARAGTHETWGKLLGSKRAAAIPRVLVQDKSGAARELLDRDAAIAELAKLGKIDAPEPPRARPEAAPAPAHTASSTPRVTAKAREQRRELATRLDRLVVAEAITGISAKKELGWWRWVLARICDGQALGEGHPLRDGLAPGQWEEQLVSKATSVHKARAIVTGLLVADITARIATNDDLGEEDEASLGTILRLLGIDRAKVAEEVADADAAEPAKSRKGGRS